MKSVFIQKCNIDINRWFLIEQGTGKSSLGFDLRKDYVSRLDIDKHKELDNFTILVQIHLVLTL